MHRQRFTLISAESVTCNSQAACGGFMNSACKVSLRKFELPTVCAAHANKIASTVNHLDRSLHCSDGDSCRLRCLVLLTDNLQLILMLLMMWRQKSVCATDQSELLSDGQK